MLGYLGQTYTAPDYGVRLATPAELALQTTFNRDYAAYKAGARYPTSYDGWLRQNQSKYSGFYALRSQILRRNLGFTTSQVQAYRNMRNPQILAAQAKARGMALAQAKVRQTTAADAKRSRYAKLCREFVMPPLADLGYSTLKLGRSTVGMDSDEPASEKREMRARYAAANKAIKLYALGLGPPAVPKYGSGGTLYWNLEIAYKAEVCGRDSLTPAEIARGKELSNQASAMLHKRAKKKRMRKIKKVVAVAATPIEQEAHVGTENQDVHRRVLGRHHAQETQLRV